jgi:hypothetical protein
MRTLLVVTLLLAGCAAGPDQLAQKQLAYYTPACEKLGYTTPDAISKCVDRKLTENEYFWSTTQDVVTESGSVRASAPMPPEPPSKDH